MLWVQRTLVARGPHARLRQLSRFDERLRAHLDGLTIADEHSWAFLEQALQTPGPGEMFAATIRAIETRSFERLVGFCALAEAVPQTTEGMKSALG